MTLTCMIKVWTQNQRARSGVCGCKSLYVLEYDVGSPLSSLTSFLKLIVFRQWILDLKEGCKNNTDCPNIFSHIFLCHHLQQHWTIVKTHFILLQCCQAGVWDLFNFRTSLTHELFLLQKPFEGLMLHEVVLCPWSPPIWGGVLVFPCLLWPLHFGRILVSYFVENTGTGLLMFTRDKVRITYYWERSRRHASLPLRSVGGTQCWSHPGNLSLSPRLMWSGRGLSPLEVYWSPHCSDQVFEER